MMNVEVCNIVLLFLNCVITSLQWGQAVFTIVSLNQWMTTTSVSGLESAIMSVLLSCVPGHQDLLLIHLSSLDRLVCTCAFNQTK